MKRFIFALLVLTSLTSIATSSNFKYVGGGTVKAVEGQSVTKLDSACDDILETSKNAVEIIIDSMKLNNLESERKLIEKLIEYKNSFFAEVEVVAKTYNDTIFGSCHIRAKGIN